MRHLNLSVFLILLSFLFSSAMYGQKLELKFGGGIELWPRAEGDSLQHRQMASLEARFFLGKRFLLELFYSNDGRLTTHTRNTVIDFFNTEAPDHAFPEHGMRLLYVFYRKDFVEVYAGFRVGRRSLRVAFQPERWPEGNSLKQAIRNGQVVTIAYHDGVRPIARIHFLKASFELELPEIKWHTTTLPDYEFSLTAHTYFFPFVEIHGRFEIGGFHREPTFDLWTELRLLGNARSSAVLVGVNGGCIHAAFNKNVCRTALGARVRMNSFFAF